MSGACAIGNNAGPAGSPRTVAVTIEMSAGQVQPGDLLAIAIRAEASDSSSLAGLQGTLRFDPVLLSYKGQADVGGTIGIVNDTAAAAGQLRVVSAATGRLPPRSTVLIFEDHQPASSLGIECAPE